MHSFEKFGYIDLEKYSTSAIYCKYSNKPPKFTIMDSRGTNDKFPVEFVDISIAGQTISGDWVDIGYFTIKVTDLLNKISDYEFRLVKAWESINF